MPYLMASKALNQNLQSGLLWNSLKQLETSEYSPIM